MSVFNYRIWQVILLNCLCFFFPLHHVVAQLTPDQSLGKKSSIVNPSGDIKLIGGGAIRNQNLFHSFQEFNVNNGQKVYFANPDGIGNILTRVTGSNVSNILGTLGVNGSANLFLINPNGIIFGNNASLDISGSFTATTAESILIDNYKFSAINPDTPPLLKINITPGLQYGKIKPESKIENQGVLKVGDGQNLSLIAGKVNHQGSLIAPGGKVEISGADVQLFGTVDTLDANGNVGTFLLDPKDIVIEQNGTISGQSVSQALATNNVILQANNDIAIDDDITGIGANNLTLEAGRSVNIAPNRNIILNGGSFNAKINDENALPSERDTGIAEFIMNPASSIITSGGDVNIVSGNFANTSQINIGSGGIITGNKNGDGGNINLSALGDITTGFMASGFLNNPNLALIVSDFFPIETLPGTEQAGDIKVISSNGNISSTNYVLANALGEGGDIFFQAEENLTFSAPGEVGELGNISSVGMTPGELKLTSGKTLLVDDVRILNIINGNGKAKGIILTGKSILIENSSIVTATRDKLQLEPGTVQNTTGGDIKVQATDDVVVRNGEMNARSDSASTNTKAGDLSVNTRRLRIIKDAQQPGIFENFSGIITTAGNNSNGGGDLTINATESIEMIGDRPGVFVANNLDDFLFTGGATINARTRPLGQSGDLTINTARLIIKDGATISTFPFAGKGGDLTVNANDILVEGFASIVTGSFASDAGDLDISSDRINVSNGGIIATTALASGDAGNLTLRTKELTIDEFSSVSANSFAEGNGGILNIEADSIDIIGGTDNDFSFDGNNISLNGIIANSFGSSQSGSINIKSDRLTLSQGGQINTNTINDGAGGDININTRILQIDNGAINASTSTPQKGGDINIFASESIDIKGIGFEQLQANIINPAFAGNLSIDNFNQGILTVSAGKGAAGNISIQTSNFTTSNGGLIATTTLNQGTGGDININTQNILKLDNSLLSTGTFSNAQSGNIFLNARKLTAIGGAQVITNTFAAGRAGNLTVNVSDSIDLIDPSQQGFVSGLFASSTQTASGRGGDINVTTKDFNIVDGAAVSVSGEGTGNAGNVNLNAFKLFLDNSSITATSASGEGGNINLRIGNLLLLRNNSQISTRAGTEARDRGNGGNITINGGLIVAVPRENSDINANAFAGNGGNITITTPGLFGLEFRNQDTIFSDITASSQFGIDGDVSINIEAIDPTSGLVELPETLIDPSSRIIAGCPSSDQANFIISGRGGLPQDPRQVLRSRVVVQDLRNTVNNRFSGISEQLSVTQEKSEIIEATGWIVDEKGNVELVADNRLTNGDLGGENNGVGVKKIACTSK